jgi:hypothetical protein
MDKFLAGFERGGGKGGNLPETRGCSPTVTKLMLPVNPTDILKVTPSEGDEGEAGAGDKEAEPLAFHRVGWVRLYSKSNSFSELSKNS